jgi:hypothetical protein
MSPEQKAQRIRVGAVTLGSMLLILVILTVLLVVSDLRASSPEPLPCRTSDGITAFAVDTLPTPSVVDGSKNVRTAYVVRSKTGTEVFVYTRNADGVVTDPD